MACAEQRDLTEWHYDVQGNPCVLVLVMVLVMVVVVVVVVVDDESVTGQTALSSFLTLPVGFKLSAMIASLSPA